MKLIPLIAVLFHLHLFVVLERDKIVDDHSIGGEGFLCASENFDGAVGFFDLVEAVGIEIPEHVFFFVETDGDLKDLFHFFGLVPFHVADGQHGLGDPVALEGAFKIRHGLFEIVFDAEKDDADLGIDLPAKKELPPHKTVPRFEFFDGLVDERVSAFGIVGDIRSILQGFEGLDGFAKQRFRLFGCAAYEIEVSSDKSDEGGRKGLPPRIDDPEIERDKKEDAREKREK